MTPKYSAVPTPGLSLIDKDHTYPGFEGSDTLMQLNRRGA